MLDCAAARLAALALSHPLLSPRLLNAHFYTAEFSSVLMDRIQFGAHNCSHCGRRYTVAHHLDTHQRKCKQAKSHLKELLGNTRAFWEGKKRERLDARRRREEQAGSSLSRVVGKELSGQGGDRDELSESMEIVRILSRHTVFRSGPHHHRRMTPTSNKNLKCPY